MEVTISAGCSFYNVHTNGKLIGVIRTFRRDKRGHLTRRSDFEIMGDVHKIAKEALTKGGK